MRTRWRRAGRGSFSAHSIASTPSVGNLVQPQVVDLARIVQAIEIDVEQRQPAAAVFLDQRERRAADLVAARRRAFGQAAHERRLPRSEVAVQQDDRAG